MLEKSFSTGSIKELSATVDEDIYTPVCNIEYKGYSFVGWNTIADGTGKMYSENENIKNISTTNVTLYAIWNQKEFTLTIKPNNGEPDVVRILHYNDIIEMV